MRIWDIDPGYLSRRHLKEEHRDLHALYEALCGGQSAASPAALGRWRGHLAALGMRHQMVSAELRLIGHDPCARHIPSGPGQWPECRDGLYGQMEAQRACERGGEGRISVPTGAHRLWAQHKYSVMARSQQAYREIGRAVSACGKGPPAPALCLRLLSLLRAPAPWPRSRDALAHMWGYVSKLAEPQERAALDADLRQRPRRVLDRVAELSSAHGVSYILESTALGELRCHLPEDGEA